MLELDHGEAEALVWLLVVAVAALMGWRVWQALGPQADRRGVRWYRYWYYPPLFLILAWIVGSGGIPDYWKEPGVYLRTAVVWIGLCFVVGETVNGVVRLVARLRPGSRGRSGDRR